MLTAREEELKMVNGGSAFGPLFGGAEFDIGDRVISKSKPDLGVGIVMSRTYDKGWFYTVAMNSEVIFTYESDLEYPIK